MLSIAASFSVCEHNWSAYYFIHSKKRNYLKPSRVVGLAFCFGNLCLSKGCNIVARATSSSNANGGLTTIYECFCKFMRMLLSNTFISYA